MTKQLGSIVLWGWVLLIGIFLLAPLVIVMAISFTDSNFIRFPPQGFSLKWYAAISTVPGVVDALILSLQLAALSTVISSTLGTLAALGLTMRRVPGKELVTSFLLSPLVFPSLVVGVALLQFYRATHYDNVFMGLLLAHVVITVPYATRTVIASLEVFDFNLVDAARTLGADGRRAFFEVILPLIRPGVVAGAVFGFIVSFDNYTVSMFLSDAKNLTLPIRLFHFVDRALDPTVAAMSSALILLAVVMLIVGERLIGIRRLSRIS